MQTGKFLVYSYPGEYFNFSEPKLFKTLLSYQKGLFVYTPVIFIALFGLIVLIIKKQYYQFTSWLLFFFLITYIYASWWVWDFGCSYGHRAYIDFYPIFCILLAILLENVKIWLRILIVAIALLTIPVNIAQTIQYERYIFHWTYMDKQKYWNVFLRLEERFMGLFWKDLYEFKSDKALQVRQVTVPDTDIPANNAVVVYIDSILNNSDFSNVNLVEVSFSNEFSAKDDSRIEVFLKDEVSGEVYYYYKKPLIHYAEGKLGDEQQGRYYYKVPPHAGQGLVTFHLNVFSADRPVSLKNLNLDYFIYNE
jgi:hypothetical protein